MPGLRESSVDAAASVDLVPPVDDPDDPQNWPRAKKSIVLACTVSFYFLFTFLTTVTVPTFPQLQEQFGVDYAAINYTVAVPALALAVSPLFWTPLADTFGRRIVMITGCLLAFVSTVGSAVATTYSGYMAARFMMGFGVGPASTVGLAMLQDIYSELERGEKVGYWTLSIDLGLLFGPLIGGFAALKSHTFPSWLTAIFFGVLFIVMVLFLPETFRSRELQSAAGTAVANSKLPFLNYRPIAGVKHPKIWDTALSCVRLLSYPTVSIPIVFYCWTWYWFIMCPITMIPAAYPDYTPQQQGLLSIGLILGTSIAEAFFSGRMSDILVTKLSHKTNGIRLPEHRLWLYWPAALSTTLGLILFGCSIEFKWHWALAQFSLGILAFGIQIGNTTTVAYAVDSYPHLVMQGTAFYSFHLNLSAFASPFFIVPWVDRNGWLLSFSMQGVVVAGGTLLVVPFLQKFGRSLREKHSADISK